MPHASQRSLCLCGHTSTRPSLRSHRGMKRPAERAGHCHRLLADESHAYSPWGYFLFASAADASALVGMGGLASSLGRLAPATRRGMLHKRGRDCTRSYRRDYCHDFYGVLDKKAQASMGSDGNVGRRLCACAARQGVKLKLNTETGILCFSFLFCAVASHCLLVVAVRVRRPVGERPGKDVEASAGPCQ